LKEKKTLQAKAMETLNKTKIDRNIFLRETIGNIIGMMQNGIITASEIAAECYERIKDLNDYSKVWVVFDEKKLLSQANSADERMKSRQMAGLLEGIPVGVKDILNTADFPTQMGSPLWKGFTPGNDAREVYYLKKEGAVIPGKTDTAEFAVHAIGNCINPHDLLRTPGTSSSGSAVAVALGMVPASIGTQTAGSIVRPASFCGVYGCKPSFGLLPRTGMLKTTDSLDTIGFFTAMYEDLKRMFETLRVRGANFPMSNNALSDNERQSRRSGKPWKVAFVKTHTWENAYSHTKEEVLKFAEALAADKEIEVTEAELPEIMKDAHAVHEKIYDKTLSYYFKEESLKPEMVSDIMNEIVARGSMISAEEYHAFLEMQSRMIREMDRFLTEYDIVVSHSTAGEAPLREEREKPDPALMWTLTHLPVINCPVFISPGGLPFGIQIASRKYNDYKLFRFTDHLLKRNLIPAGSNPLPPQPEE
jgi:Asp-tRNA(Asn)/Glu-tRNA(Gln) amidotransferase A subunit family amidase